MFELFLRTQNSEKKASNLLQRPAETVLVVVAVLAVLASRCVDNVPPEGPIASAGFWKTPDTSLTDYDFLRQRVMEEHGWSKQRAEGAIVEYLRFLEMLAAAPTMELVASSDIDLVWHEHLVDTKNYAEDCMRTPSCSP
eukprot:TRINITY_DN11646_c0_g1_i3.p1 TRINITY_DN11646_c0_g1~~TRINITY_DN11646_c0_g1_i3.p1  ORF type:complete len:162 (-),score=25.62 TRINITY_DN11646_c0_g1_i3:70-486(-)